MAQISNKNFLNYTKLTYSDILEQVNSKLNKDPKFENFRESAIAQTMVEIFAATADLVNYYIERRAEEAAGFDTAQLKSSIIALSRQLGYVIQRPIPASSSLKILLKGPINYSITAGDTVTFEKFNSTFTYGGNQYILKKTYQYTFTPSDVVNLTASNYIKTIDGSYINDTNLVLDQLGNVPASEVLPIEIVQGVLTSATFDVPDSSIFQEYVINDTSFSNYYGNEDISYDAQTSLFDLSQGFTKVGVGTSQPIALASSNLFEIDRRSLLTSETVLSSTSVTADGPPKVCLIRTRLDEGVDLVFGDDIISDSPDAGKVIVVQYLSTVGANANEIGVIDKKLTSNNTILTSNSIDITDNIEFRFNSNIINGANMESIDSIKLNSPSLFYSLDRLVSKSDYVTYLKSLSSPINVKNAVVWGEQEEAREQNITAIQSLCNVVLYSLIGSMYYKPTDGTFAPKSLSATTDALKMTSVVLEGQDYSTDSEQVYFDIINTSNGVRTQLSIQDAYPTSYPIAIVNNKIKNRAQITTRNIYVPPIIQHFYLDGKIYINNLSNLNNVKKIINNSIYEYLDNNADYSTPIYLSKITKLIEDHPEVIYADVKFIPVESSGDVITSLATTPEITAASDPNAVLSIVTYWVNKYLTLIQAQNGPNPNDAWVYREFFNELNLSDYYNAVSGDSEYSTSEISQIILPQDPWNTLQDLVLDEQIHFKVSNVSERTFYNILMKQLYNSLGSSSNNFRDSAEFKSLMAKLNNQLKKAIRNNILDSRNNITNYSLKNEIALVEITATYNYR